MSVSLAILPKPFCAISILCSVVVIREVLHPKQSQRNQPIGKCLLNLAIADCIASTAIFFSTWPIPSDVEGFRYNVGSVATCSAQGFFAEIGVLAAPLFSVNLSVLFLLIIRFNATEVWLLSYQFWSQIVIWICTLGFAVLCLCLDFYNPVQGLCWLSSYPESCRSSETEDCIRGDAADIAAKLHGVTAFVIPIFAQAFVFGWIFRTVYVMESARYEASNQSAASTHHASLTIADDMSDPGASPNSTPSPPSTTSTGANRERSNAVAVRSLLYIGGHMITYALPFIQLSRVYFQDVHSRAEVAICFLSLQGFWVFLVFMKNRKMFTSEGKFVKYTMCCCLYQHEMIKDDNVSQNQTRSKTSSEAGINR